MPMMDLNGHPTPPQPAAQPQPGVGELLKVALILPPIRMAASSLPVDGVGMDCDVTGSIENSTTTAITVLVPAMYVCPFSRVACELLDDETLPLPPPTVDDTSSNNNDSLPSTLLRPITDFTEGEDGDVLQIDVSNTQVVQLPPLQTPPPKRQDDDDAVVLVRSLITALFKSSFGALQQYQVYTQYSHMKSMTTLSPTERETSSPTAAVAADEDVDVSKTLQGLLKNVVVSTFTDASITTATMMSVEPSATTSNNDHQQLNQNQNGDHNHDGNCSSRSGINKRIIIWMLYVLTVLEVLDCPLLSETLSDVIVERGASFGGEEENGRDDNNHRLLMAELLLL